MPVYVVLPVALVAIALVAYTIVLRRNIRAEKILTYFATSLYGQNSVEDIFWDVAKNCIRQLHFEDCIIYQFIPQRNVLVQRAAFGPKNPEKYEILNPIEIPYGEGIVGSVAKYMKSEIVSDTSKDPRYIVDDFRRYSEITVPIMIDGELFGIIDSEHSRKNFYSRWHLQMLENIAGICAVKISKYMAEEKLRLKIARDLHDEVGSTLTSINIISKMAIEEADENQNLRRQLTKIKDYSATMMETMNDIVWAINPSNDNFDKVLLRMKEFAAEILEPASISYYFREEGEPASVPLNLEQRKDIYMIFKEALNNAVKYSGATELNITVRQEDSSLQLLIMDNGNGFDTSKSFSGNGMKNMQCRAQQIKGELKVDSICGSGTSISVKIPVTSLG